MACDVKEEESAVEVPRGRSGMIAKGVCTHGMCRWRPGGAFIIKR